MLSRAALLLLLQIGKVVAITKPDEACCSRPEDRDVQLDVNWFYRPEEAVGGRKVRPAGVGGFLQEQQVWWKFRAAAAAGRYVSEASGEAADDRKVRQSST
jgi:hypothetical protein